MIQPLAETVEATWHRSLPRIFMMANTLERGGTERQFVALAQALNRARFQLKLGCIQRKGAFLQELGEIEEFRLGGNVYGWESWRARLRLAKRLRQKEVALAHAFDFYTNLTLIPAARLASVPVVIGSQRQLGDLLTRTQAKVQTAALSCCDRVVCNSQAAATGLVEAGVSRRKIVVIGNGLPARAFVLVPPAMPRRAGTLRVGMIARMNADYKNHSLLLTAVSRMGRQSPPFELLFVGDGPLRPALEKQAEQLQIRHLVQFVGDRADIPGLLASMDVSVVPSRSESLSNVILESMAASVPVLATDVGGNRELLGNERGLLVRPDDPESLTSSLRQMLLNPGLRSGMAAKARQYAENNFALKAIQARYEQLYSELLEEKGWRSVAPKWRTARDKGRIKVAIVAPTLRWVGGQAVQADLLLRHWCNDPEIEARFVPIDPPFPRLLSWTERIPGLRTVMRQPLYLPLLWEELKAVDVVHIFSASYWSFLLAAAPAWAIARLHRKKTLINYRSGEGPNHLQRSFTARMVLRHTGTLVVPSGYLKDVFERFGLRSRIVPNLVDLSQFGFRERNPPRPHLLCTRGFHPYYAIDIVLQAFAEIQHVYPDARLDLLGKGPCEKNIRRLVQELRVSNVHFMGVASRHNIGEYYDQADIFINASYLDNMPVSVIEAFACGLPVVTTSPPSMRYLVSQERTGLLSKPGDAIALAQNVIRVLRNPALAQRLATNGHEDSLQYRWPTVRQQWLNIYQDLFFGIGDP